MNGGEVIQRVKLTGGRAGERDGEVPARTPRRAPDRALPSALIMIPVVAFLSMGLALVALSAMTMSLSRAPAAAMVVDEDAAEGPWVSEPADLGESRFLLESVYTR